MNTSKSNLTRTRTLSSSLQSLLKPRKHTEPLKKHTKQDKEQFGSSDSSSNDQLLDNSPLTTIGETYKEHSQSTLQNFLSHGLSNLIPEPESLKKLSELKSEYLLLNDNKGHAFLRVKTDL